MHPAHIIPLRSVAQALASPITSGPDLILGTTGQDVINGLGGNDTIYGDLGDDHLSGAGGDDLIYAGPGLDTVRGGAGDDQLHGSDVGIESFPPPSDDLFYGGAGNDYIEGASGNDTAYGGDGADTMLLYGTWAEGHGGAGNDLILAGAGILWGDAGDDTLQAQDARGGSGNDSLIGDSFGSILTGGAGLDTLTAISAQADTLTGGKNADTFVFLAFDAGRDVITDYNAAQDGLDLSDFLPVGDTLADHATQIGADVEITFGNLTIVVQHTTLDQITLV